MNAFGYVRNTIDLDIWIASDVGNQMRVLQALREFAFPLACDDLLRESDAMLRMAAIHKDDLDSVRIAEAMGRVHAAQKAETAE